MLTPPTDWKTSLDIKNPKEISHYWSHMVSIIEFEAFLTGIVSEFTNEVQHFKKVLLWERNIIT
jgi:hypothetical protein